MSLLAYCQLALRLGSSRGLSLRCYREGGDVVDAERFARVWAAAQAAERLFDEQGGLREQSS